MNSILTSILFLAFICTSGAGFSQGPAKGMLIAKRTVIKDSLGNNIRISDCTDRLKSNDWMLHPEKNEQGKMMYLLLKRTTQEEKELFSDNRVSSISAVKAEGIKRGKFVIRSNNGSETLIKRKGNKQIERTRNEDGSKRKTKYSIVWLDDASYILKPWNKVTEMAKTPRYKVVEVTDEYYAIRVLDKSSLGPIVKVYVK